MTTSRETLEILARLRTIRGHLRAVEHLAGSGQSLRAVAQLHAVRAALGDVAAKALRHHVERCMEGGGSVGGIDDLLAAVSHAVARARRGTGRSAA